MDADRVIADARGVGLAAVRAYTVWVALFVSSGVRDGDPGIRWVIAGCVAVTLAYIASLVLLAWRAVHE